jgi:flagellar M-ring protein FliF
MKDQLSGLAARLWAQFKGFTAGQKAVTIVAALALLIGGYVFLTWKSTPQYAPLYTNLAASDASAIVDKLNSAGVPYQLGQAGTEVLVPQDKVYSTRLTVSASGLPSSSQTGYSLLDKEGVTTSEFQQQVDFQRAIEGELDKTIESMTGVQTASVHLAMPQQNVFNDGSQQPTAAVLLTLASGTQLTTTQVQSIVYLVSSSVPNLSADKVTVTDSSGALLAAPGDNVMTAAGLDTQSQAAQTYDQQLASKIQALLAPVVGAGHSVVTVDAQLNFDKTSSTERTYVVNPKAPPLSESTSRETYTGSNAGNGGTLGSAPTGGSSASAAPGGKYNKVATTKNNALGTNVQTVETAPGSPVRQSVAVLLDSSVKGVSLAKIRSLVDGAALLQPARGDKLRIEAMPFDTSSAKAAAAAEAATQQAAAKQAAQQRMASLIKQGALAGIVLAVILATWIASRRRRKRSEVPVQAEPEDFGTDLFAPRMESLPVAPEPPVRSEPAASERLAEQLDPSNGRRTLVTLAEQQPEEVASVISGWLSGKGDYANARARNPW